jgi:RimJ/RimL family protein N-acetyltransferase
MPPSHRGRPRRKGGKNAIRKNAATRVRFAPFNPDKTRSRQLELFETATKPLGQRVVIQKSPRKMIATLDGHPIATLEFEKRECKIGNRFIPTLFVKSIWVKDKADQQKGVGTRLLESFIMRVKQIPIQHRKYRSISLDIDSENARMIGVAERAGFKQVGRTQHGDYSEKDFLLHYRLDL